MKLRTLAVHAAIAAVVAMGASGAAFAQADCKSLVQPSPFGPDDQTGASNRVTPAVTKAAAAEIKTGEVVPMANVLVDGIPLFGTRFSKDILTAVGLVPGAELGKNQATYMEDTWLSQSHVGTHFDGMGHIGIKDCYYNQTPMGKYVTQNGLKKLGLEHLNTFATRGVIIDMVRVFKEAGKLKKNPNCKGDCLDGGTLNAVYNASEPGIGMEAAKWLADQKVVLIGSDTFAVEVWPSEDPSIAIPVHVFLLPNNGIHIIENVRTDLIAAAAQKDGRATFFLNMTVPKAVGFTGNFVNIEAIR
jgi:kynurenine formamidase